MSADVRRRSVSRRLPDDEIAGLCASFQRTVVQTLLTRTFEAARWHGARAVGMAGGVSANSRLRAELEERGRARGLPVFVPPLALATDNAAMIAAAGVRLVEGGPLRRRWPERRAVAGARPESMAHQYPTAPVVGVGGSGDRRRSRVAHPPGASAPRRASGRCRAARWSWAKRSRTRVRRELREETGLDVVVGALVEVFDRVHRDDAGRVRYHFVIADYLCHPAGGALRPGDDAADVAWVTRDGLAAYGVNAHAVAVIEAAFGLHAAGKDR